MVKPKVVVTIGQAHYSRMFNQSAWEMLESFSEVRHHQREEPANKGELINLLPDADACITSWGVAQLDEDVMQSAPKLQAMAHMGSSVKRFISQAVWDRGIHLTSAGIVLAQSVAETTLGMIIVGLKNIWPLARHVRDGGWRELPDWQRWYPGEVYQKNIGVIGSSNVGQHLITLLKPFKPDILLYDPYVSVEDAEKMGVVKMGLEDLLKQSDVVTLHAPANPETHHLLNANRLSLMKDNALLINTARGSLIDEEALVVEMQKGRFFAFLDVTDPEPPLPDSPLRQLENVVVVPHIAGCIENCSKMGELAVEELRRYFAGEPAIYQITPDMLERIS